jgi:hypothetical protein
MVSAGANNSIFSWQGLKKAVDKQSGAMLTTAFTLMKLRMREGR